jgi:hypothetical protein
MRTPWPLALLSLHCMFALLVQVARAEEARSPQTADEAVAVVEREAKAKGAQQNGPAQLHEEALREAAQTYGAQAGAAKRWRDLDTALLARDQALSETFRFQTFYLQGGALQPPILDAGGDISLIEDDGNVQQLVDRVYRVLVPARLTHAALTWRDFLLPDAAPVAGEPRTTLLPRNRADRAIWAAGVKEGWSDGQTQANEDFRARLAALSNAYQGMALYTFLALRGMIEPPKIAESDEGTSTSRDGRELAVNHRERVIASAAYFVGQPGHWQPIELNSELRGPSAVSVKQAQ